MKNRRILFRVILKSLLFFGFLAIMVVFLNSLFIDDEKQSTLKEVSEKTEHVSIDTSEMRKGEVRRVRWGVKDVAVLYRQFSKKIKIDDGAAKDKMHQSLSPETRSIKPEYFVFINHGDSGNCPLYYAQGEFNDTCTTNIFDENGVAVKLAQLKYQIKVPPHYFEGTTIRIGSWQ